MTHGKYRPFSTNSSLQEKELDCLILKKKNKKKKTFMLFKKIL